MLLKFIAESFLIVNKYLFVLLQRILNKNTTQIKSKDLPNQ